MTAKTLPGIKTLEFLPADETVLFPKQIPVPGSVITILGEFKQLPTIDLLSCVTTDERTDAGLVYTTKVSGNLKECDDTKAETRHRLAEKFHTYRITDVYGVKYQLGIDRKPYPEIFFSPVIDGQSSGSRVIPFEINWKSDLPPLELTAL